MTVDKTLNLARAELKHYLPQGLGVQIKFCLDTPQNNIVKKDNQLIFSAQSSVEILYLVYD